MVEQDNPYKLTVEQLTMPEGRWNDMKSWLNDLIALQIKGMAQGHSPQIPFLNPNPRFKRSWELKVLKIWNKDHPALDGLVPKQGEVYSTRPNIKSE